MNFQTWQQLNKHRFDSSYERLFVENVLSQVAGLDFQTVQAQYPFKDIDGRQRYCDFVIQEGSIRIAIEVDGYDKDNSGRGMTHAQFVDWQRRQASLTSEGWHVLRFANRDVRDQPARCRRYIELLLQDQRSKSQHQQRLATQLEQMSAKLAQATQSQPAEKVRQLQAQITQLKNHLALAQSIPPLTAADRQEKKQFEALLDENAQLKKEKQVLDQENQTMKTTVWAFTVIIGLLIAAGVYVFVHSNDSKQLSEEPSSRPVSTTSESAIAEAAPQAANQTICHDAISWSEAATRAGERVTVQGTVAEYRYMQRTNGQPTWINLGAKYPDKNRFTLVIWGNNRASFGTELSAALTGRTICATGIVRIRNGIAQMVLRAPQNLFLPQ